MQKRFLFPVTLLALLSIGGSLVGCQASVTTTTATVTRNNTITRNSTSTQTATVTATEISTVTVTPTPPEETTPEAATRVITDMYGHEITVPSVINRVLTSGPVEMELVYMLAPEKLAGLSMAYNGKTPLVSDEYRDLPLMGGWFGTQVGNYEEFIAAEPDIVLYDSYSCANVTYDEMQTKFGNIPVVGVSCGEMMFDYEDAIRFLGELLGVQDKAEALIEYYKDAMLYVYGVVSDIPESERVKVYYAEGKDGFSTDPDGSMHTILLTFCGGINVADVPLLTGFGMAEASIEQILLWDPDMIIIGRGSQANLYNTIMTGEKWADLRAVQAGKVFVRPDNPFSWFDGPIGPCQILGMYWTVSTLYPEQTAELDLSAKIKEFYSEFFHYELTDEQVTALLSNPS
jgi:iron complex transport system substrate-binding protein